MLDGSKEASVHCNLKWSTYVYTHNIVQSWYLHVILYDCYYYVMAKKKLISSGFHGG